MTTEDIKNKLEQLKANLYDNYAIYHERVTLLIQLTQFDILETRVNFKAKIIKPLNRQHAEKNRLYHNMMAKDHIEFGASYFFGTDESNPILTDNILGRPYCPFTLSLDPALAKFMLENEDEITKKVAGF